MSSHERGDFPPRWDPPPRIAYGETRPPLLDVVEMIAATRMGGWVRNVYLEKLDRQFGYHADWFWNETDEESLERLLGVVEQLPEGPEIMSGHGEDLEWAATPRESDTERERKLRERLARLLGVEVPRAVE